MAAADLLEVGREMTREKDYFGDGYGDVHPPSSFTVDHQRKPILYMPDGTPLVKKPAGFDTRPKED